MSRTAESPLSALMWSSQASRLPGATRRQQLLEHVAQIADERGVHRDVLVDLRRVDLDVNLLRVRRVGLEVAGDAIVEAHAERHQQVGFLDRVVDPGFAVHAHHAEVERMRRGDAADAEQRHRDRNLRALGETRAVRPSRRRA